LCGLLHGQGAPQQGSLTDAQWNGKKMFQQRCSICHTAPLAGSRTYGPLLSANAVVGKEVAAREIIMKGTARMPGFQYGLERSEIDNIIEYLKTVRQEPKKGGASGEATPTQD